MKLLLATVALGLTLVDGFSHGEFTKPADFEFACSNLYPNHGGILPKTGDNPYSLTVIDNGNTKNVTISGTKLFKGFILQAKTPANEKGKFTFPSSPILTLKCVEGETIRHNEAAEKTSFSVNWDGSGPVTFEGAAVEQWTTFYKLVTSV